MLPLCGVVYFYFLYFSEPQNPLREEYLFGIGMTVIHTLPLWLGVALAGWWMRPHLSRWHWALTPIPMLFLAGAFLLALHL